MARRIRLSGLFDSGWTVPAYPVRGTICTIVSWRAGPANPQPDEAHAAIVCPPAYRVGGYSYPGPSQACTLKGTRVDIHSVDMRTKLTNRCANELDKQ
eukprot:3012448-Rhodomonas_salina.2